MLDVAIIGGGLSGLSLASHLMDASINYSLFEARSRFGGRILSKVFNEDSRHAIDLGPSWIWPEDQPLIANLIEQYKIEIYSQWTKGYSLFQNALDKPPQLFSDPATYADAYRVKGGMQTLVDCLLEEIPVSRLNLDHEVNKLINKSDHIEIHFTQTETNLEKVIQARQVVIMLPPNLCAQTIFFEPHFDERFMQLMKNTPTWMASHAKVSLMYSEPFWRQQNLSGSAYTNYPNAILGEIFDSSSENEKHASLTAFFALPATLRRKYRNDLEALILDQMIHLFGQEAAKPQKIVIQDWFDEKLTATAMDQHAPAAYPDYGHKFFRMDHWNDKLYFGGSETASVFGGYLEGALQSANYIARQLSYSTRI